MNLYKRGLIFATFLGCSLSSAFLAASLSTNHWIYGDVQRLTNPSESDGYVHFGLFNGKRELNVGYGWRSYPISVTEQMDQEPDFLHFGLWAATVTSVGAALLFSLIGALMGIVNTASTPVESMAGRLGLIVWNTVSVMLGLTAVVTWVAQYYLCLTGNILIQEDRENQWTSEGQARLGYSFWFVIGSASIHVANIILLALVNADQRRKTVKPLPREKTVGAVLLY